MLNSWFAAYATPEKQRPAVSIRKQLCGCRDAESAPSVWINVSAVRWPDFVNAAEVNGHAGCKQHRRPEPQVQIPAWISSGCWAPQREGTLQGGAKQQNTKKTQDELSEHTASLRTQSLSCGCNDGNVLDLSGQFKPVCSVWMAEITCREPREVSCAE